MCKKREKIKKKREKRKSTTLGEKAYIGLFTGSILAILLFVAVQKCECAQCFICTFLRKTVEFVAAGMLPAVLVAFLQDLANTKREQEDYRKKIKSAKACLKEACLYLPSEILVCINSEECAENGLSKSFVEWCQNFSSDQQRLKKESQYYAQFVLDVERAAIEFKGKVSIYEKSILERTRLSEKQNVESLIKSCKALRMSLKYPCKERFIQNSEELSAAVLEMFTETGFDSDTKIIDPEILKYYKGKYNSETLAEEGEEQS